MFFPLSLIFISLFSLIKSFLNPQTTVFFPLFFSLLPYYYHFYSSWFFFYWSFSSLPSFPFFLFSSHHTLSFPFSLPSFNTLSPYQCKFPILPFNSNDEAQPSCCQHNSLKEKLEGTERQREREWKMGVRTYGGLREAHIPWPLLISHYRPKISNPLL